VKNAENPAVFSAKKRERRLCTFFNRVQRLGRNITVIVAEQQRFCRSIRSFTCKNGLIANPQKVSNENGATLVVFNSRFFMVDEVGSHAA
jgi:hypothetical protein